MNCSGLSRVSTDSETHRRCLMYREDFWDADELPGKIELTCLMPDDSIIVLPIHISTSVLDTKIELWQEVKKLGKCKDLEHLVFYDVHVMRVRGENFYVEDESRTIEELQPLGGVLNIVRSRNHVDNYLNEKIARLIGNKWKNFNASKYPEVIEFQRQAKYLGTKYAHLRSVSRRQDIIRYQYPPRLAKSGNVPQLLTTRFQGPSQSMIQVVINVNSIAFTIDLNPENAANVILKTIIDECSNASKKRKGSVDDFVLKVVGREEYIFGTKPLIQFIYIQETLIDNLIPHLILCDVSEVPVYIDDFRLNSEKPQPPFIPAKAKKEILNLTQPLEVRRIMSFIVEINYRCTVRRLTVRHLSVSTVTVHVAVFYGVRRLCEPVISETKRVVKRGGQYVVDVNETFIFNMAVKNLPPAAKLCFVITEGMKVKKNKKKQLEKIPKLYWVNVTCFDYKGALRVDDLKLHLWKFTKEQLLHNSFWVTIGTTMDNVLDQNVMQMDLGFYDYCYMYGIVYPGIDYIYEYVETYPMERTDLQGNQCVDRMLIEEVQTDLCQYTNFIGIQEKIREKVWRSRYILRQYFPTQLYRLIELVDWTNHREVFELFFMLRNWPKLDFDQALVLLDHHHTDPIVRAFAVACFELTDDEVLLYLMQLIQGLRSELFPQNSLSAFLFERVFNNQRLGHYLYWHLRSMLNCETLTVQFSLILDSYLRGCDHHISDLSHQLSVLETVKACSEACRSKQNREKVRLEMMRFLGQPSVVPVFKNLINPLDPALRCSRILMEKCRVMDSKMRPIWLVFENHDKLGDNINVIYKCGDDLRQDMLALQIIKIMDIIWKSNGYEYRMSPYQCLAIDYREGLIEVVTESNTIANIQKAKSKFAATSAWHRDSLYLWLSDNNRGENELNQAVEEFTLSCAGYSIATFVLGIADRHSDNILVRKNGQLFHIDFGHILGNFKEKFGIRRERTAFVLTNDFVFVMNHGLTDQNNSISGFEKFERLCNRGFILVRKQAALIISLFRLMKTAGLPELNSDEDLKFLNETFLPDAAENDALRNFHDQFTDSLMNNWKTSINWTTHNMSKSNN